MISNSFGCSDGGPAPLNQACAACKHQRRKCTPDCQLARFFPAERTKQFQSVHKVYGVSYILKLLSNYGTFEEKKKAVDSLCWEVSCRERYPLDGSLGFFNQQLQEFNKERQDFLQEREKLQKGLDLAQRTLKLYEQLLAEYSRATGVSPEQLVQRQSFRQLLQKSVPPVCVPQDACFYQMPPPPHYYQAPQGIQQQGGHNGATQRIEMMVPQDQHYTMIDTQSSTSMVTEEHKTSLL